MPNPINPPAACNFHPRCPRFHEGHCDVETPPLDPIGPTTHFVACHYPLERWPMDIGAARRRAGGAGRVGRLSERLRWPRRRCSRPVDAVVVLVGAAILVVARPSPRRSARRSAARAARSAATGLYMVGCFLIVARRVRRPPRARAAAAARTRSSSRRRASSGSGVFATGIRTASGDERADARSTTWLFLSLGLAMIVLGVAGRTDLAAGELSSSNRRDRSSSAMRSSANSASLTSQEL